MAATEDRYSFQVEWFDQQADVIRRYMLTYYPRDNSVDMYDQKNHRPFLRRSEYAEISLNDMYIGATVTILARQLKIIDYADDHTKKQWMHHFAVDEHGNVKNKKKHDAACAHMQGALDEEGNVVDQEKFKAAIAEISKEETAEEKKARNKAAKAEKKAKAKAEGKGEKKEGKGKGTEKGQAKGEKGQGKGKGKGKKGDTSSAAPTQANYQAYQAQMQAWYALQMHAAMMSQWQQTQMQGWYQQNMAAQGGASPTAGGAAAAPAADAKEYLGELKKHTQRNGYGFIECAELKGGWPDEKNPNGRDIYIDTKLLPEGSTEIGSKLKFTLKLNAKGHPQAATCSAA